MERLLKKPLHFAEILDLTFRVIKNHFFKFYLLLLILLAPMFLLSMFFLYLTGASFISTPLSDGFDAFLGSGLGQNPGYEPSLGSLLAIFGTMLLMMVVSLVVIPLSQAAVSFGVDQVRKGEEIHVGGLIKKAFSRFWPLFGSSLLYLVILTGMYIVTAIIISIFLVFIFGALEGGSTVGVVIGIILSVIVGLGAIMVMVYFLIRWGFYFVAIVFEQVAPGLSKSWRLTRRNFWRIFALFLIIMIISYIISFVLSLALIFLLGNSILANLISDLLYIFTLLIFFVAYTIMYFDLRVRNDAADLKEMVKEFAEPPATPDDDNGGQEI